MYDEKQSTKDTACFVLKHDAGGDTEKTVTGKSLVSFNLKNILDEGQTGINIVLKWHWYNPQGVIVEHIDSGYYGTSSNENMEDGVIESDVNIQ